MPAPDEPLLKIELSDSRLDLRPQRVVGGRQDANEYAEPSRQAHHDVAQRQTRAQETGAGDVEADVPVTESEPRLLAEGLRSLQGVVRLVANAPAPVLVEQAGERVEHRVEVGRD